MHVISCVVVSIRKAVRERTKPWKKSFYGNERNSKRKLLGEREREKNREKLRERDNGQERGIEKMDERGREVEQEREKHGTEGKD